LIARAQLRASAKVKEVSSEQIGTALRRLAADLVAERRRVALLERENRELRAQLDELRRPAAASEPQQRPSAV
jgi:molybdopterin converting factor small subunit